jgi:hypothetical protein
MSSESMPANVSLRSAAVSIADAPRERAMCAAVMVSGASPNAFEQCSRITGPPIET